MYSSPDPSEFAALRTLVDDFIHLRLTDKLDKLKDDDEDKRQQLIESHRREAWVADAARRVGQIQLATHTLKHLHPDARGTTIYLDEAPCPDENLVGTHVLAKDDRADDVVGNAAALDVFKFLKLSHNGRNLLQRALNSETSLAAAMSDQPEQSMAWLDAFAGIVQARGAASSHTLAKQLYFPIADDQYHLLAPLYPTALVHRWHQTLMEDRFGEPAKEARLAKKEQRDHPHGFREYPGLVVQNFGGTKPQNISQLNSERGGAAYLLPSFPPDWQRQGIRPPIKRTSVFGRYGELGQQPEVKELLKDLRTYLNARRELDSTMAMRDQRAELVNAIVDAVIDYQDMVRSFPAGWSKDPKCKLDSAESSWLDADHENAADDDAAEAPDQDDPSAPEAAKHWRSVIAFRFASWLNAAISAKNNPMADEEHQEWLAVVRKAQARFKWEAAA